MRRPAFFFCVVAALFSTSDCTPSSEPHDESQVALWTREYGSRRAKYYLKDARRQLDQAIKNWVAEKKGESAPDPYLKIWDAQSQLSAALSWDEESPELWFEAGNLTFTLAGFMREIGEGEMTHDCLSIWQNAMALEAAAEASAAAGSAGRPLSRSFVAWIEKVEQTPKAEFKKKLPQRLWLKVRSDVAKAVRTWDVDAPAGRGGGVTVRGAGRLAAQVARSTQPTFGLGSCGVSSPDGPPRGSRCAAAAVSGEPGSGWLSEKMAGSRQDIFPTPFFRTNIQEEMGAPFFERLSEIATNKYTEFREERIKDAERRGEELKETQVNDAFFQFQETMEHDLLHRPEVRAKWPELYETDEFKRFLSVARNASIGYLQNTGARYTDEELERSWIIAWSAVYPQDVDTKGRHGWHTHQESVVSGVLYANPRNTPILFADPRGAPPIEDYEQYRLDDLLYEPKAPFDEPHQVFAGQGDLVVFPSWLVHKVPPPILEGSGGWRVAFPFNFHLGARKGTIWDGWERTAFVQ